MDYRLLGRSGFKVSELTYGNWVTHGSQIEEDAARECVHAALDCGITSFDTADVYARGRAEEVLGRALKGQRREGLEIFTKVYWPMGEGPNDAGLSRKHIREGIEASLRRLRLDYVDLVRSGKALYIGVSEWRAEEIRAARALADELHVPLVSNQPQYSAIYRVIEAEVVPTCREAGISQIVWSPLGQGVLTGKYRPGQA